MKKLTSPFFNKSDVYNVLQLNSSLLSMQSRRPSQRLHRDLHSPEPQRNCVAVSHAAFTHTTDLLPD